MKKKYALLDCKADDVLQLIFCAT